MNSVELLDILKRRTGFLASHAATLKGLEKTMSPLGMEVALAFYDYLAQDDEMREIIWATPDRIDRLYKTFAAWYKELFGGVYDAAYAHRRYRIGLVHARLGVGPRHMVPAMGIVQELSLEHMSEVFKTYEVLESVEAFQKIIAIEIAMIDESYLAALEAGLRFGESSTQLALVRGAVLLLHEA
jgi:hypothetical protein